MEELLLMLKTDLGITTTAYDVRLKQVLTSAQEAITAEGALNLNPCDWADAQLIVMYAAWIWRRRDTMDAMPRMLRWMLNNRVFGPRMEGQT